MRRARLKTHRVVTVRPNDGTGSDHGAPPRHGERSGTHKLAPLRNDHQGTPRHSAAALVATVLNAPRAGRPRAVPK